jgi:hypothetical protein
VLHGLGTSFGQLTGAVALGNLAAQAITRTFDMVVGSVEDVIKSANRSQEVVSQLGAVLKSTGGVAGVTSKMALDLASSLQKVTKFSDEDVLSAENLLLTFTKISKDIFPQATKITLDMATALGEDTKSAAIQLGKALQDPILGVTALRRVGVNFSDAQRDVIKSLVDTGQQAQAQALIMKELQTEFGGSAEAAGKTFAGQLAILKNQIDDVKEGLGLAIINGIQPFTQALSNFVTSDRFHAWATAASTDLQNLILGTEGFVQRAVGAFESFKAYLNQNQVFQEFLKFTYQALQDIDNTVRTQVIPSLENLKAQFGPEALVAIKAFAVVLMASFVAFLQELNLALSTIGRIIDAIATLKRYFNDLADLSNNFAGNIVSKIPGIGKIGARAGGGPVSYNTPYLVGENGPEIVVPNGSGTVIPNNQINHSQTVATTINVNLNAGAFMGSPVEARKFAQQIVDHINDIAGQKNMTGSQLLGAS